MSEQGQKEVTISLSRDKMVNIVLVVIVALLLVFGWQLMGIKGALENGSTGTQKVAAGTGSAPTAVAPSPTGGSAGSAAAAGTVEAPNESDYIRGNANAKVTLIEYSDFECPFCQRFHPTAQQALDEYGGDVNWVFRHFPLSFHPTADAKAQAVECAAEQGGAEAFWAVGDAFFTGTLSAPYSSFQSQIEAAGVNYSQLETCVESGKYATKVSDSQTSGVAAGVTGTPGTIVYNNETGETSLVPGAVPYSQLKAIIDSVL